MISRSLQRSPVRIRGFTLLEVLIALAILAISSLAILGQTAQSIRQQQQLQLQTHAMLVAENQLTTLQILPDWPGLGRRTQSLNGVGEQWRVTTEISSTSDPWLRKIEISVAYEQSPDAVITQLTGYRGLH